MIEEKKGFFQNLAEKTDEKMTEMKLQEEIGKSFEMQATQFQSTEVKFIIAKKFYGVYNIRRGNLRFRIEDKIEEREVYKNASDPKDEKKYIIKKIVKDNVKDFMVKVKEKEYAVKCYLAEIEIL